MVAAVVLAVVVDVINKDSCKVAVMQVVAVIPAVVVVMVVVMDGDDDGDDVVVAARKMASVWQQERWRRCGSKKDGVGDVVDVLSSSPLLSPSSSSRRTT